MNRDIVAIGASAGGVHAVGSLLAALPGDLPASVFVVVHTDPAAPGRLSDVLAWHTRLKVAFAVHGEEVVRGRVYVAPPDNHVMLHDGAVQVVRGPKENGHRPAVDALFRTAAKAFGPRAVGVVLTGRLDCGTAGLMSILARGGLGFVQSPGDALASDMPSSALAHNPGAVAAPLAELPSLLLQAVDSQAPPPPGAVPGSVLALEGHDSGERSHVVCPACGGAMTEAQHEQYRVLRCHEGHTFSADDADLEQQVAIERALWSAARALDEGAAMSSRMASVATGASRARHDERARSQAHDAQLIRQIILRPPR